MAKKTLEITKEIDEEAEEFSMDQSGYLHGTVRQRDAAGEVWAEAQVTLAPDRDIEPDPELQDAIATIKAALLFKAQEGGAAVTGSLLAATVKVPV